MYVAMPYFVFMEAMVSWLINGENIPYVWNPCCLLHFTVLWARIMMGHVCPSFARNSMVPLCYICFIFMCCHTLNGPYRYHCVMHDHL